jgi:hypothetical protein
MFAMFQNIALPFWKMFTYTRQNEFCGLYLFNVSFKHRNGPSAKWASAANTIDGDIDIFNGRSVSIIGYHLVFLLGNTEILSRSSVSKITC